MSGALCMCECVVHCECVGVWCIYIYVCSVDVCVRCTVCVGVGGYVHSVF